MSIGPTETPTNQPPAPNFGAISGTNTGQGVNASSQVLFKKVPKGLSGSQLSYDYQYKTVDELKKSFLSLSAAEKKVLSDKLIEFGQKPTRAAMSSLWNLAINQAAVNYSNGSLDTPWDVLKASVPAMGTQPYAGGATTAPVAAITQIDADSARVLLEGAAAKNGIVTKFTSKDINNFVKEFNTTASQQGSLTEVKTIKGVKTTVMKPSRFSSTDFTNNYLWAHTNFTDTNLRGPALTALSTVKQLAADNNLDYLSDAEVSKIAKDVASGVVSLDDVKSEMSSKAALYYPQFADRLKANPGASLRDIVSPQINILASAWEMAPSEISLDNPLLDKALRPDGTAGKVSPMSIADLKIAAKMDPKFDSTTAGREFGRDAAVAFAKMSGFGA